MTCLHVHMAYKSLSSQPSTHSFTMLPWELGSNDYFLTWTWYTKIESLISIIHYFPLSERFHPTYSSDEDIKQEACDDDDNFSPDDTTDAAWWDFDEPKRKYTKKKKKSGNKILKRDSNCKKTKQKGRRGANPRVRTRRSLVASLFQLKDL